MRPSRSGVRRTQKTEENKKEAIKKRDGKLLQYVNNGYETMHLFMGYDGSREKIVCDAGFERANAIIDHCAMLLPKAVCA